MREKRSLDDILKSFDLKEPREEDSQRERKPVTIWIPASAKARYDRLQVVSGRRFSKKARELLLAAIDMADGQRAS